MDNPLSQADIDNIMRSLLPAAGDDLFQVKSGVVRPYDFMRPTKFKKDVLRALVMIHENFARLLKSFFLANLRIRADIHVRDTSQYWYSEYLQLLPNPTVVSRFRMDPLPGVCLIEMSPNIAFAIIDRVFGGGGADQQPQRALSEIERGVIARVMTDMLGPLQEAWKHVTAVQMALVGLETNPMFLQSGTASSDVVVSITVAMEIGEHMGHITLTLPHSTVDPVLSQLSAKSLLGSDFTTPVASPEIKRMVSGAPLAVDVYLGKSHLTVRQLMAMEAGDILTLDTAVSGDVQVYVGDRLAFTGRPGVVGKHMSVQIRRHLAPPTTP